jgi:hypothetical protein
MGTRDHRRGTQAEECAGKCCVYSTHPKVGGGCSSARRQTIAFTQAAGSKRTGTVMFTRMSRLRMAKGGSRWALTGTPVQNRETDIKSIFKRVASMRPEPGYKCNVRLPLAGG